MSGVGPNGPFGLTTGVDAVCCVAARRGLSGEARPGCTPEPERFAGPTGHDVPGLTGRVGVEDVLEGGDDVCHIEDGGSPCQ